MENEEALEILMEFAQQAWDAGGWPHQQVRAVNEAIEHVTKVFDAVEEQQGGLPGSGDLQVAAHTLPSWPDVPGAVGLFQFRDEDAWQPERSAEAVVHLANRYDVQQGPVGTCEPQPPGFPAGLAAVPHRKTTACRNWQPLPGTPAGLAHLVICDLDAELHTPNQHSVNAYESNECLNPRNVQLGTSDWPQHREYEKGNRTTYGQVPPLEPPQS